MRRVALAAVVVALIASTAHANGRPPMTNGIKIQPGDPHSLYVASTFGLLVSHDDGCTFRWACEQNVGYGGQFDPKYAVTGDGTIFATTFTGLRVSRDGGCSFKTATAELPATDPNRIADIWIDALDVGPTGEIWVGTAESGRANDVFVSTDGARTFASRGMLSPTIWWKSVRVAPTSARRVYITGYQVAGTFADGGAMPPTAHLLRSDDGGAHWAESPLTGVAFGSTPIVLALAVDPANADVVYLASIGANQPGDRLYRSSDGGLTFTEVLATAGTFHDVLVRDAQTVLVTTNVQAGTTFVGGPAYRSGDGGRSFAPIASAPQLACLAALPDGTLVGCGANWDPDFKAIGKSTDGGATWSKIWRFVELAGPLDCPAGTAQHDTCATQLWPPLQQQFATTGPSCGGFVGDGPAVDGPPTVKKPGGGCCEAGAGAPIAPVGLVWAVGVAWWLGRRRRARG